MPASDSCQEISDRNLTNSNIRGQGSGIGPMKGHKGEGHRKRLREKFLASGLSGFHDYEVIELLLTNATGYINCLLK